MKHSGQKYCKKMGGNSTFLLKIYVVIHIYEARVID